MNDKSTDRFIAFIGQSYRTILDWGGIGVESDIESLDSVDINEIFVPSNKEGEVPTSIGLWVWEGEVRYDPGPEGEPDIVYDGIWRKPTITEIAKLIKGTPLWRRENEDQNIKNNLADIENIFTQILQSPPR